MGELKEKIKQRDAIAKAIAELDKTLGRNYQKAQQLMLKEHELREKISKNLEACQYFMNSIVNKWNRHDSLCDTLLRNGIHIPTDSKNKVDQTAHVNSEGEERVVIPALYYKYLSSLPHEETLAFDSLFQEYTLQLHELSKIREEIKPYLTMKEEKEKLWVQYMELTADIAKQMNNK